MSKTDADGRRRPRVECIAGTRAWREAYRAGDPSLDLTGIAAPRVTTWLTPRERAQLDAAAAGPGGCLVAIHRDTLAATRADLATGAADALLVSVACLRAADVPVLGGLVRGFPGTPVAGVVADSDEGQAVAGALLLGGAGVRVVFDVRTPSGWRSLRAAFAPRHLPDAFLCACVASVLADLRHVGVKDDSGDDGEQAPAPGPVPDGLVRFFGLAFAPDVITAKALAVRLGTMPSTLASRFFRAGLPSPRRYVALARLTWAAWLGEQPGRSLADIAHRLNASAPQSFYRAVRTLTGRSAAEFRRTTTGRAMLEQYRATLVAPYRETLRTFDPTAAAWRPRATAGRHRTVGGRAA